MDACSSQHPQGAPRAAGLRSSMLQSMPAALNTPKGRPELRENSIDAPTALNTHLECPEQWASMVHSSCSHPQCVHTHVHPWWEAAMPDLEAACRTDVRPSRAFHSNTM